ncbi:MAG: MiaB/RimO family radical methylthiotransferase [Patescibacteria group bacterium]|nr:MiaB/RimO family radical methylthiotransferase [Patescibacteria group bacterium]
MVGRTEEILITGKGKTGRYVGRTGNFKEVFLLGENVYEVGSVVKCRIEKTDDWVLL